MNRLRTPAVCVDGLRDASSTVCSSAYARIITRRTAYIREKYVTNAEAMSVLDVVVWGQDE
jgi:hypothetical protein